MRTLQEKYNAINEGKFSKDQFLRDARLQLPNLVTQYNGYDDAVKILKNRGMIQEQVTVNEGITQDLKDGTKLQNINSGAFYTVVGKDNAGGIYVRTGKGLRINIPAKYFDAYKVVNEVNEDQTEDQTPKHVIVAQWMGPDFYLAKKEESNWDKKDHDLYDRLEQMVTTSGQAPDVGQFKKLNEANQLKTTKKGLTDYRYKPTNDMDKYPYEQILRGLRVELEMMGIEGTPTAEEYQKALAKVLKNLEKDEIYYTNQVAGIKANRKRTDLMTDATPKNEVDKENGLQKAQLKEAIKKVIKNILSEDLDPDLYPQDEEREERKSRYGQSEFGDGEEVYEMYADSDGDYEHDREVEQEAYDLYDRGQELYNQGNDKQAEMLRQQALKKGAWLGWNETDLPPYKTTYEIPGFEGTRDALDDLFESVSLKDLLD